MKSIDDLPEEVRKTFVKVVDDAIIDAGDDEDLKQGFSKLDEIANEMKVSFYDLMLQILEYESMNWGYDEWKDQNDYKE